MVSNKARSDEDFKTILSFLMKQDAPVGTKEIAEGTSLAKTKVTSKLKGLKKNGLIGSPVRCKYSITTLGKDTLN